MVSQAASLTSSSATVPNSLARAALALANVQYEKKGSIACVTVNRPKVLNALNTPTWTDLQAAFEDAKADASVHGVILTGAGDKAFIAGAAGMSDEGAVTGDGFADDQILHLIGAFVGVQRLRIGEEARDIVVGDDAVAAQDLAAP